MKIVDVVAGIIFDASNKVLIARRAAHKSLAGKWEFPGGKVEQNETHEQALERELLEEFDILTRTKQHVASNIQQYEHITINLIAYVSEYLSGEFKLTDHDKVEWVKIDQLLTYDMAEADVPIINRIILGAFIND